MTKKSLYLSAFLASLSLLIGASFLYKTRFASKIISPIAQSIPLTTKDLNDLREDALQVYASGGNDEAISNFESIVQIDPDDSSAWYYLGNLYRKTSRFDDAIRAYKRSIETDDTQLNAYVNLYSTYQQKNDLENGIKTLELAVKKYPQNKGLIELLNNALELRKK